MKKIISVLLAVFLLISMTPDVFAKESNASNLPSMEKYSDKQYEKEDILALEKYVSVKDGYFVFDYDKAKSDGYESDLLEGQQAYFKFLNSEISAGNLHAEKNLNIVGTIEKQNIVNPLNDADILACKGKTTKPKYYWWGYSRKLNSCFTSEVAADFGGAGSVAAGIAVVAAVWGAIPAIPPGLAASYWGLISNRLNANNKGKGVVADVTWALFFDIEPQK
ncbi:hypothetical protein [Bacillus atrophaeus]|uniref:hypothetical protein n=1 Tax=Bacillus atrophaeus TaxID=1452 RepID=UPI00227EC034|nr:hypothetical protein [Bacillus atrophaeus]MCY8497597.1 hypothetical protein [Bacillus atrophaeus]MCY8814318.1 hypothetical protein [Bacillus atrophaeus]MCY8816155.1 hypothetical protein [Bacillus atrophaeus]MCY8823104.1 hypothetical protein [Bacillus atrophaeus]MCY8828677.1 hypothetical protein [Bacillus atrophaeus]